MIIDGCQFRKLLTITLPKVVDNFVDASAEVLWDEGERKEREDNKKEHKKKVEDLER
jgi:hypothetical protein